MFKCPDQRVGHHPGIGKRTVYPGTVSEGSGRTHSTVCLLVFFFLLVVFSGPAEAITLTVRIEGLEGEILKAALSTLSIEKQKEHPYLNDSLIRRLHFQAPQEISRSLQAFGFYRPDVDARFEQENETYAAVYTVTLGNPILVSSLDIQLSGEGARVKHLVSLTAHFPLVRGEPLLHRLYEEGKKALLAGAVQRGYLDAAYIENRVLVDPDEGTAQVVLHLNTGPSYMFGPVIFKQSFLSPRYLNGYVTIREGDPYDLNALLDLQKALYDSNQFSRVEVTASRSEAEGLVVPVMVILEPGPRRRFTAGVGFGTDTGPRARTGWEHRRLNTHVHRLKTELLVSRVQSRLSGLYTVPLKRPRTDRLEYSLTLTREQVEDINSDSVLLGLNHVRLRGSTQFSEYLRYLWEDYDVATDEDRTALLYPGVALTWVLADNRIATRQGFRLDLELQGSQEGVLSHFSFLQARARAKFITPLWDRGRLIFRAERATTWTEDFQDLPGSLRYFAGGDQSVRGFAYKSLSPRDASGQSVGGRYLVVGSAEYEQGISGSWSAAVFTDVGNALEDMSDPLERGAGLGVRWQSIVGLVRLDVAWALSHEDSPWRIHLNIGPDL